MKKNRFEELSLCVKPSVKLVYEFLKQAEVYSDSVLFEKMLQCYILFGYASCKLDLLFSDEATLQKLGLNLGGDEV